jgi:4-hydroxy-tetrahydrodipicolinate synthase
MNTKKITGLGTALVTPFKQDFSIDIPALRRLVELQINGGVDFLVVQGTTGESPTLTASEKQLVLETVAEVNQKRLPIVYGVGGNNTMAVAENFKKIDTSLVDGILSVSPYYNKPTQEGIFQHYRYLSETTDLPIILYNVPGRTASNVLAETTLRLAEISNIVAMKEASGNMEQIMEIIRNKPAGFLVLSGDDALTLPIIACGGDGVISVVSNGLPEKFSKMVHAALAGDLDLARKLHYELLPITKHFFAQGNPAGIKEALVYRSICERYVRLPLVNVSPDLVHSIVGEMEVVCGN